MYVYVYIYTHTHTSLMIWHRYTCLPLIYAYIRLSYTRIYAYIRLSYTRIYASHIRVYTPLIYAYIRIYRRTYIHLAHDVAQRRRWLRVERVGPIIA